MLHYQKLFVRFIKSFQDDGEGGEGHVLENTLEFEYVHQWAIYIRNQPM